MENTDIKEITLKALIPADMDQIEEVRLKYHLIGE